MSSSDARLVDAAQAKVNRIADAIDGLTIDGQLRDMRLQANQIINAQHQAMRAMLRPDTPTS